MLLLAFILMIVGTLFAAVATILLSKQLKLLTKKNFFSMHGWYALLGVFFMALAIMLNYLALAYGKVGVIFAISAFTYVWSALLARKLLGETITTTKWIGIFIIFIGASLLGIGL
jgi:drug/metabolite transporter (DMT)-like permease